eukprot:CCRYP_007781-RE/>CCRYP_007781-RE protein AED:0.30 eAED:0.30 QI:534/1/1/1/0/0/2/186/101
MKPSKPKDSWITTQVSGPCVVPISICSMASRLSTFLLHLSKEFLHDHNVYKKKRMQPLEHCGNHGHFANLSSALLLIRQKIETAVNYCHVQVFCGLWRADV